MVCWCWLLLLGGVGRSGGGDQGIRSVCADGLLLTIASPVPAQTKAGCCISGWLEEAA